jgi:hypothetical protein
LGAGLSRAVGNYMRGLGLDRDVRNWFDVRVPGPKVPATWAPGAQRGPEPGILEPASRLIWLGERATAEGTGGRTRLVLVTRARVERVPLRRPVAEWVAQWLTAASPRGRNGEAYPTVGDLATSYPGPGSFTEWARGRAWTAIRRAGLVAV